MKRTIFRTAALAAVSIFALAGCGLTDEEPVAAPTIEQESEEREAPPSDGGADAPEIEGEEDTEETEEAPAVEQGGPGVYQAELYGSTVTVAVPGTAPEDLEQFRQEVGADPVGYLVVEVDNTEGTEEVMVFTAEVVDSEGKTHTYEEITTSTYDWTEDSTNYDLIDRQMELWDKYPYSTLPTAKNTVPLVGPEVPEDIVSVFIEYEQAERVGDL